MRTYEVVIHSTQTSIVPVQAKDDDELEKLVRAWSDADLEQMGSEHGWERSETFIDYVKEEGIDR